MKLKIFSIILGVVIGLLFAEIAIRVYKYSIFQNLDEIEFGNRAPVQRPNEELKLGEMIQISSFKKIIYELIPNSSYKFKNVLVETNEDGFRDKHYPELKEANTKRIIGIGDSGMFGWGVENKECYISQIEHRLNKESNQHFEIINTSVPGYNTVMEVAVLENRIQLDQVDLVIIDFISNDFELPSFIRKRPDFLTTKKSFLLIFLEENFIEKHQRRDKWLNNTPENEHGYFESDPKKVPDEYRDMVGKENYVKAMERLKALSLEYGFRVLVLSQSPFLKPPQVVTETCKKLEFEFIDFAPFWEKYKAKNPAARWKLAEDDWHPTVEGHSEVANVVYEKLISSYFKIK